MADPRYDRLSFHLLAGIIGDRQVRHRGTIGGSLAHGDPASDLPAAVLALGGSMVIRGAGGAERTVNADDFFQGFLETAIGPDELLVEVRVPKTGDAGWSYQKFTKRAQDWAIVGAAVVIVLLLSTNVMRWMTRES